MATKRAPQWTMAKIKKASRDAGREFFTTKREEDYYGPFVGPGGIFFVVENVSSVWSQDGHVSVYRFNPVTGATSSVVDPLKLRKEVAVAIAAARLAAANGDAATLPLVAPFVAAVSERREAAIVKGALETLLWQMRDMEIPLALSPVDEHDVATVDKALRAELNPNEKTLFGGICPLSESLRGALRQSVFDRLERGELIDRLRALGDEAFSPRENPRRRLARNAIGRRVVCGSRRRR